MNERMLLPGIPQTSWSFRGLRQQDFLPTDLPPGQEQRNLKLSERPLPEHFLQNEQKIQGEELKLTYSAKPLFFPKSPEFEPCSTQTFQIRLQPEPLPFPQPEQQLQQRWRPYGLLPSRQPSSSERVLSQPFSSSQ